MMKEFKVNEYITLKLEGGKTNIYVKGQLFNQCKFLLLNIPVNRISSFDEIDSIDEAAEKLDRSLEGRGTGVYEIPPEVEFWGHCSNLQVWAEMDYDTRILHRNIAFPLLEKLSEVGDPKARKVLKKEIIKRLSDGYDIVKNYLIEEGYLDLLTNFKEFSKDEVIELLFDKNYDFNSSIKRFLKMGLNSGQIILNLLGRIPGGLIKDTEDLPQKLYKKGILKIFLYGNKEIREYLTPRAGSGQFDYLHFAYRDTEGYISLIKEIFHLKDINALRFLYSHNYLYLMSYLHEDVLRELIFDSNYNYQDFFKRIIQNESDFRIGLNDFIKELAKKGDARAKDILKKEIKNRLKDSNLDDLWYLIKPEDLDDYSNDELKLISFKSLEDQHFLNKFTQSHSLFKYSFDLLKKFIERGFENERNLLKNIFLRELDKKNSILLKKLISGGYMEYLNENDKKEIVEYLISIGNLNVFLELDNRYYIKLIDYENELLTPNTKLNMRLLEALNNPEYIDFGFRLLEWFAEKGTKNAKKFLKNQILKWIKTGPPEILSFLKDKYQLREYFHVNSIKSFIEDNDSQFLYHIKQGLTHKIYYVRKNCFELFEIALKHLNQNDRNSFITVFNQKIIYHEKKMPDTAFQGIQGLLMLGAFHEIRNFLKSKGYYEEYKLRSISNQVRNYSPFPSRYQSDYDQYEEEDDFMFHTLQFLIFFIDSRESLPNKIIKDEEFNALHKFIRKAGEFINTSYILNNFNDKITNRLEDYLVKKLSVERDPQSFRKILEFIEYYFISVEHLNTKDFLFKVLDKYTIFKKTNKKYNMDGIFINYIYNIHKRLGDDLLEVLMKIFDEDFSIIGSYIDTSLNPEYDISEETREIAFKTLVLLVKSRNNKILSTLLNENVLVYVDQEWLLKVFNEVEEQDLEFFFYGMSNIDDKHYHYYEEIGDQTYLVSRLIESLNKRKQQEKRNFINEIIRVVISKFPDLFEFLVESELFKEITNQKFQTLLKSSNNQFIKSILKYMKKHVWRNEKFDKLYHDIFNDNLSKSLNHVIHGLQDIFLDMLYHFDTEFYNIVPHIKFYKKFGENAFDMTFKKIKKWLNDEEYPHYNLFTMLINNDFLEIVDKGSCLKKLKEISNELIAYLKYKFESESYRTGFNALTLIKIYFYTSDDNFILSLLKELSTKLRENVKNSILNLIESNERKNNTYYKQLDSKLEATALKLVKLIEVELDVEELKYVTIKNKKHYMINKRLDLSNKEIYDIEEIEGLELLSELKDLDLSSNFLTEIKGFDSLVNLESLNLDATLNEYTKVVSEIKGLEKLINLKNLSLQFQKISEINGLKNLTALERLMLNYNRITEIKNLENLKKLHVLSLENNNISEINGLENLKDLVYLNLGSNRIKEIKGLDNLKNLESLWLSSNELSELKGLENLYNLQRISVERQRPGYSDRLSLDKSKSYHYENGPKYVVHCLKKINKKIEGTINCPNPDCDAIVYSVWDHCPICYKPIKMENKS